MSPPEHTESFTRDSMANPEIRTVARQHRPLIVRDAVLCAIDGTVQTGNKLWHHFQRFPWHLDQPELNPRFGEHRRQVLLRLSRGLPDPQTARELSGKYHLGISPHIGSYYHLITDLVPHLIRAPRLPVLISKCFPISYRRFLEENRFQTLTLPPGNYRVEKLWIPEMPVPEWNKEKIKCVRKAFLGGHGSHLLQNRESTVSASRLYISRKKAGRRHLVNEEQLFPILSKYGFVPVFLEDMEIRDQIRLFRKATHVIAPHGAGLSNIVFAPLSTRILEIRPVISSGNYCFDSLCRCGWKQHEVIVPKKKGRFELSPNLLEEVLQRWQREHVAFQEARCT